MSAPPDTNIDQVIYVRLLDEGTDVWRPVPAKLLADGSFRLSKPDGYDPEAEIWEFPPNARVTCAAKRFADGEEGLVAIALAG